MIYWIIYSFLIAEIYGVCNYNYHHLEVRKKKWSYDQDYCYLFWVRVRTDFYWWKRHEEENHFGSKSTRSQAFKLEVNVSENDVGMNLIL